MAASRTKTTRRLTYVFATLFLFIFVILTLQFRFKPNLQPFTKPLITQAFGIGFDLTPSYGTVAVAYPNESTITIAKIEGDALYKEMMHRLSLDSSKTTHQPYRQVGDNLLDWPRHLWRDAHKKLGLPASRDVWTLSRMISALRTEASTFVGDHISAATISIPFLAALYGEDTVDAFEYLSLINLEVYYFKKYYPIYTVSSVYLANAHKLVYCIGDANRMTCPADGQPLREAEFSAITISFTHSSLAVGVVIFSTCYSGLDYGEVGNTITDTRLGYDSRHDGNDEAVYWNKVTEVIRVAIREEATRATKVIVWGDAAAEPKFMEILHGVVEEGLDSKQLKFIDEDPIYSGARGSAEFAKRALNGSGEYPHPPFVLEQAEL